MMSTGSGTVHSTAAVTTQLESVRFAGPPGHKETVGRIPHANKLGHSLSIVRDFEDMPVEANENSVDDADASYGDHAEN